MLQMYEDLTRLLNKAAVDDRVVITALTGAGDCYSSGNDMSDVLQRIGVCDDNERIKEESSRIQYGS
jgi:enoyl-CoA hydratase/carnithine racemase